MVHRQGWQSLGAFLSRPWLCSSLGDAFGEWEGHKWDTHGAKQQCKVTRESVEVIQVHKDRSQRRVLLFEGPLNPPSSDSLLASTTAFLFAPLAALLVGRTSSSDPLSVPTSTRSSLSKSDKNRGSGAERLDPTLRVGLALGGGSLSPNMSSSSSNAVAALD